MTDNLKQEKIKMWTKKLSELEKELEEIIVRKGEAAREGDLRENAAFQMASEDADTWRARIDEVKNILAELEKDGKGGKRVVLRQAQQIFTERMNESK